MLLDALTKMPGLELLILRHCIPPAHAMTEYIDVDLPNLERLELAGSLNACADLLRQITINASTTLTLNLTCSRVIMEDVCRFLDVFPSLSAAPVPNEALYFASNYQDFEINAWLAQQSLKAKDPSHPRLSLNLRWTVGRATCRPDIMWDFFSAFASPQLRSFRMSGDPIGWDVYLWRGLAKVTQNLQGLVVDEVVPAVELCEALHPPDRPNTVSTDCCLPMLSYLELGARYNHAMSTPDEKDVPLSAVLADCLAARAAIGCLTPELVFIVPPFEKSPEGWSEPFREAVPGIIVRESRGLDEGAMP
ncbi:hypothetical protein BD779DRAFT_1579252 [Infundibulicybe gibba]|nr:hypothetical protein BD779DRAFT_1579252 [Infundibulicybe gibba]